MPLELLTLKDLHQFKVELLQELKNLFHLKEMPVSEKLLKTKDVCRILRISEGTLQNLRNNETIGFKKIGGIIYYRYEDIERLIGDRRRA